MSSKENDDSRPQTPLGLARRGFRGIIQHLAAGLYPASIGPHRFFETISSSALERKSFKVGDVFAL
jgi:hypothetical protein